MTRIIDREEWAIHPTQWKGEIPGDSSGAGVSIIFNHQETPGGGPRLHRHPYPETFIIRQGTGLFTLGDETIRASAGQIVVVPPGVPHKFTNEGPGPMESIDIHASPQFVTEWLE